MRNCYKCLENDWSFEKIEDIIRATCNQCGYEVEFEAKKKKKQKKTGDKCKKCGGVLFYKKCADRPFKKNQTYFYTGLYKCRECGTTYLTDKFKQTVK